MWVDHAREHVGRPRQREQMGRPQQRASIVAVGIRILCRFEDSTYILLDALSVWNAFPVDGWNNLIR